MSTKSEWIALAERCEKATGLNYFDHYNLTDAILSGCGFDGGFIGDDGSDEWQRHDSDGNSYHSGMATQSIDAITSLIEREFPRAIWYRWGVFHDEIGADAEIWLKGSTIVRGEAPTPHLALCAAFCRAMSERADAQPVQSGPQSGHGQ